jgi:hypothetical protein
VLEGDGGDVLSESLLYSEGYSSSAGGHHRLPGSQNATYFPWDDIPWSPHMSASSTTRGRVDGSDWAAEDNYNDLDDSQHHHMLAGVTLPPNLQLLHTVGGAQTVDEEDANSRNNSNIAMIWKKTKPVTNYIGDAVNDMPGTGRDCD